MTKDSLILVKISDLRSSAEKMRQVKYLNDKVKDLGGIVKKKDAIIAQLKESKKFCDSIVSNTQRIVDIRSTQVSEAKSLINKLNKTRYYVGPGVMFTGESIGIQAGVGISTYKSMIYLSPLGYTSNGKFLLSGAYLFRL